MARLANKNYPVGRTRDVGYGGLVELMKEHTKTLNALQKASDKLKSGEVKGFLLPIPWADGYAYYLVTNDNPLTLQPVLVHDEWQVPYYMIRGLRVADILKRQKARKQWRGK